MGELGFQELIFIGVILLVFFGPKKLPELGTGLGTAIRDFKRAISDKTSDVPPQILSEKRDALVIDVESSAGDKTEALQKTPVRSDHG